jgi:hypothetical protein
LPPLNPFVDVVLRVLQIDPIACLLNRFVALSLLPLLGSAAAAAHRTGLHLHSIDTSQIY